MKAEAKWFAVDIAAAADAVDAVESALSVLDAEGIETDGLRRKPDEERMVTGYFYEAPSLDDLRDILDAQLDAYGLDDSAALPVGIREVVQEDWLAEWKKHWKPTVTGRFIVAPPWSDVHDAEKLLIRIEPKMAFGTGTHETTRLCMSALESEIAPGDTLIDVGSGTGVLAIAAGLLGASRVTGYETDDDSVPLARENVEANPTGANITMIHGPMPPDADVSDIIVANITLDVIAPILDILLEKAGRTLILSGILAAQRDEIAAMLTARGHTAAKIDQMGEWIAVVIHK